MTPGHAMPSHDSACVAAIRRRGCAPMKKLTIVLGIVLGLGACSDKFDKAISESEGFKDKMCACKDKDCAEQVDKDMKEWRKGLKEKFDKDFKPSDSQMKKAGEIEEAFRDCRRKLRDGGDKKE
jgi:hypothetical protein